MSNYLGDVFYVLEYIGHINNGAYKIEDLLQKETVDNADGAAYNNVLAKHNEKNRKAAMKNLNSLVAPYEKSNHRYGIPSSLPGNLARKLKSIEVQESASVGIPKADLVFSNCDYADLEANSIIDKNYTWHWHDKGAGYRVWLGYEVESDVPGSKKYEYDCIFEGYVLESVFNYEKGGVTVNLSLNCYICAKASIPMEKQLWNEVSTTYQLFQIVAEYIGIEKKKQFILFGDPNSAKELKAKVKALLGYKDDGSNGYSIYGSDLSESELAIAISFYNTAVMPKILSILTKKVNPTPIQIFNIIAHEIGILLRWHITTRGYIFLGIPMNPKTVDQEWGKDGRKFPKDWKKRSNNKGKSYPPKKVFTYRPGFGSPIKAADYLSQESWAKASDISAAYSDFYDSISIGELERGKLPTTEVTAFNTGSTILNKDKEGNAKTSDTVDAPVSETGSGGDLYTKTEKGNTKKAEAGGIYTKIDGYVDVTPTELQKLIAEAFTLGNVSMTINGVIPDPFLSVLDTFEFIGYAKHSGRYIITAITYRFQEGSRPTMEIRGITPLNTDDLKRRNSGSLASVFADIGKTEPDANTGVQRELLSTTEVSGGTTGTIVEGIGVAPDPEVNESEATDLAKDAG